MRKQPTNHLGNVLATVSDRKLAVDNGVYDANGNQTSTTPDGLTDFYTADVTSATDYYPFGSPMPQRTFNQGDYRFGFNGMEKDDEVYNSTGTSYDYGARVFNPRLGRWLATDPVSKLYPGISPYVFALNTPIQAKDPDGNVVLFFNGFNVGDGGNAEYWGGFDQKVMEKIGDFAARYYDGSSGGLTATAASAGRGAAVGSVTGAPFGAPVAGAAVGAAINVTQNSNVNADKRIAAGKAMGQAQAKDIFANLEEGETIKIVTHSMGTAYSRGFVEALEAYAKTEGIEGFTIEYELDVAAFQGENLPAPSSVGLLNFKSGDVDIVANPDEVIGFGGSSNIPGGAELEVPKGTGHSISGFNADNVPRSQNNNSTIKGSQPVFEEHPKDKNN